MVTFPLQHHTTTAHLRRLPAFFCQNINRDAAASPILISPCTRETEEVMNPFRSPLLPHTSSSLCKFYSSSSISLSLGSLQDAAGTVCGGTPSRFLFFFIISAHHFTSSSSSTPLLWRQIGPPKPLTNYSLQTHFPENSHPKTPSFNGLIFKRLFVSHLSHHHHYHQERPTEHTEDRRTRTQAAENCFRGLEMEMNRNSSNKFRYVDKSL